MATIKEVADLAGVAVGTVSHVITGSVPVSDALRRKVWAAVRELDYHPNHVARSLKTSKTRTLGIIVPDMTIPYFPKVIRGAEAAARKRGYSLIAVNSDDDGDRQRDLLSLLRSQRVEGVLLVMAAAPTPAAQIAKMAGAGMRIVCVDRIPDRVDVDCVSVEDTDAAALGVEHLLGEGHRRIAIVTGPQTLKNERQRLLGYKFALDRAAVELDEDLVWFGNLRADDVSGLCRERLAQGSRPDAIFCTNGPTALGTLRALRDSGLRTPEDIAFATIDELTTEDLFYPSITSIVQPAYDIGGRAADILLDRIEDTAGSVESMMIRLRAELKIGQSSRRRQA